MREMPLTIVGETERRRALMRARHTITQRCSDSSSRPLRTELPAPWRLSPVPTVRGNRDL